MTSAVAIIICAYTLDRWADLCAAVASAAGQSPAPDEMWLVIDHNAELLERAQRELEPQHSALRVVDNTRRQGLSGARNSAIERCTGDIVVFLDDDAAATPGWLNRLLKHYQDPDVLAVGGSARPHWPGSAHRPVTLPSSDPQARGELDWVVGCTYRGQPVAAQPVRNLMGCNMSFRREVFARVGGFSEELGRVGRTPLGCEETELCIRATNAFPGAQIIFEPLAEVAHQVSRDRLTWAYLRRRCYGEGVSKAAVSAMVGRRQGLETERTYATRVLPQALLRELGRATMSSNNRQQGLLGAVAIVSGLSATLLGYVRGRLRVRTLTSPRAPQALAQPARPIQGVEL